jgi:hypothetical protein
MTLDSSFSKRIDHIASNIVNLASRTITIFFVFLYILAWGIAGFYFDFSARWELVWYDFQCCYHSDGISFEGAE